MKKTLSEIERLRRRVEELEVLNENRCVFCGKQWSTDGPRAFGETAAAALKRHIAGCKDHPLHQVLAAVVEVEQEIHSALQKLSASTGGFHA